jgi:hypothetical protein
LIAIRTGGRSANIARRPASEVARAHRPPLAPALGGWSVTSTLAALGINPFVWRCSRGGPFLVFHSDCPPRLNHRTAGSAVHRACEVRTPHPQRHHSLRSDLLVRRLAGGRALGVRRFACMAGVQQRRCSPRRSSTMNGRGGRMPPSRASTSCTLHAPLAWSAPRRLLLGSRPQEHRRLPLLRCPPRRPP